MFKNILFILINILNIVLGEDNKWYFIGYGGVPNFEVEKYIDNPIFINVFEPKEIETSIDGE